MFLNCNDAIIRKANRVVKKVGYREDIKAMGLIKKELRNKGYDL
jgi:hypothetical protein